MEITIIIALVSFAASLLTFFSGFGLGTILTPVFAIFFPVDLSIALTGVVHFLNNVFKTVLVGKDANRTVLIRFGIPAVLASFAGAWLLLTLSGLAPLYEYRIASHLCTVTPVKVTISLLLITFVIIDVVPVFGKMNFNKASLPLGGILSGFFGGLSGLQGAIRSAFLVKSGLSKEAYIATAVIIACFIDITRLSVYSTRFINTGLVNNLLLVTIATLSAISGAFLGKKLLPKISMDFIRKLVTYLLIIISFALGMGVL